MGWVGMNLVFWDGMNPSHIWLRVRAVPVFCLVRGMEQVGMDGTVNSISSYLRGT